MLSDAAGNRYSTEAYSNQAVRVPEYFVEEATTLPSRGTIAFKRVLDIVLAILCTAILIVPMIVIAVIIMIDSQGSPIYKQERLGKNGKQFTIYKFRSMRIDAEANGPSWAKADDKRCTKVGATLRKLHLDEIPQLLNIIKGDMSFVGPRPERECFYRDFEAYIHGFHNRLAVTPGLTGLAQVNGGYDLPPEKKIIYDMEYINTETIWLDIKILAKTVVCFFTKSGAR